MTKQNPKDLSAQEWRVIPGFSAYKISEYGSIIRVKDGKTRKKNHPVLGHRDNQGYKPIKLIDDAGIMQRVKQHTVVALAFIGPKPSPIHVINHLDSDRGNNHYSNLEWVTPGNNLNHSRLASIGLFKIKDDEVSKQVETLLKFAREQNISWEAIRIAITKDCVPRNYPQSRTVPPVPSP